MSLATSMRLAQMYGQQQTPQQIGPDIQPEAPPQALPVLQAPSTVGNVVDIASRLAAARMRQPQATPPFVQSQQPAAAPPPSANVAQATSPQAVAPAPQPSTVLPSGATDLGGGSSYDPYNSESRRRVAEPAQFLRDKIADDTLQPVVNKNSKLKSILLGAGIGALQAASRTGDWRSTLAGAGTGAAIGGINPAYDEQVRQDYQNADDQGKLKVLEGNEQAGLANKMKAAQIYGQYANVGFKGRQADTNELRAMTGVQRADTYDRRVAGDLQFRRDKLDEEGKRFYDKLDYQQQKDLNDNKTDLVWDKGTGKYTIISTNKRTGESTVKPVMDGDSQFGTTSQSQLTADAIKQRTGATMQAIEARAKAAASKETTKTGRARAFDLSKAQSFEEAADAYESQAKSLGESIMTRKDAQAAKNKAIAARQQAKALRGKWGTQAEVIQ